MRKISLLAASALANGGRFRCGATRCDGIEMWLYDSRIAWRDLIDGCLWVTTDGFNTRTTIDRLNALPGVHVQVVRHQLRLNGVPWDGSPIKVG